MTAMTDHDQDYFLSIPWCAKLLQQGSDFLITPAVSRQSKESTEDALFAETLKTDDTIRACLSFYRRPPPGATQIDEVHTLLGLSYGVNGHPNVCHGGIVAVIMDEAMGILLTVNKKLENATIKGALVTAYLNITYLKPVVTPQAVLVTAKLREVKGQKHYIEGSVQDGCGTVLAEAEALWIEARVPKEKL